MPKAEILSRREREMMNIIFRAGKATATEVMEGLADPPSYSAVRAMLRVLEDKGHVRHEQDGQRYVYLPTVAREKARKAALAHLVKTFFDGSVERAVTALLDSGGRLTDEEYDRLARLIKRARSEG